MAPSNFQPSNERINTINNIIKIFTQFILLVPINLLKTGLQVQKEQYNKRNSNEEMYNNSNSSINKQE